jgi:hypothetical protein
VETDRGMATRGTVSFWRVSSDVVHDGLIAVGVGFSSAQTHPNIFWTIKRPHT